MLFLPRESSPAILALFDRHGASPQGEDATPSEKENGGGEGSPLDVPGGGDSEAEDSHNGDSEADDSQKDVGPLEE